MKRRDFVKLCGGLGLAASLPDLLMSRAMAADATPYTGLALITIKASGGWDHSFFCDPRENPSINHWASTSKAGLAGNLRFAPVAENAEFFNKYYDRMLVINGVDLQTNGHDSASMAHHTGTLSGLPTSNTLFAAVNGVGLPMPWLRDGGETGTQILQPYTNLPTLDQIRQLANPNSLSSTRLYHRQSDLAIIESFRTARLQAQQSAAGTLPFTGRKLDQLLAANGSRALMSSLAAALPDSIDTLDLKGEKVGLVSPVHRFLIAIQAGVCATASMLTTAGFDTHSNHDAIHPNSLKQLTRTVDYLWTKAEAMGIADRLVVHLSSDVGRTPGYNANNGKDHWSLGSTVIMMKNQPWTNRVVGISGPNHEKVAIDPLTLQAKTTGVQLRMAHVHQALRSILGVDPQQALALRYPFSEPDIGLLNPSYSSPLQV